MNVAGASAKPTFVYESFARSRACAAATSSAWSAGAAQARARQSPSTRRVGVGETEIRGREPSVAQEPRLQLLDVRERRDVERARERGGERLARRHPGLGQPPVCEQHLEAPLVRTKGDAEHGVGSRIGHGFRPTV